jgi:3D (Asp-Asp-Asp) domain-containing protein
LNTKRATAPGVRVGTPRALSHREVRALEARAWLGIVGPVVLGIAVASGAAGEERSLSVTATAYNSLRPQTNDQPTVAAWGDRLAPGMKAIAVSRDLLALGLTRGVVVEIVGLSGEYVVLDKMARRWKRRIDIYMGEDVRAARRWGVRPVEIRWDPGSGERRPGGRAR